MEGKEQRARKLEGMLIKRIFEEGGGRDAYPRPFTLMHRNPFSWSKSNISTTTAAEGTLRRTESAGRLYDTGRNDRSPGRTVSHTHTGSERRLQTAGNSGFFADFDAEIAQVQRSQQSKGYTSK